MLKTVLFDLDGTLLGVDMQDFLKEYFIALSKVIKPYMEEDEFLSLILTATRAMVVNNNPEKTNQEAFIETFFGDIDLKPAELMPIFDEFYRNEYLALKEVTEFLPLAPEVIDTALKHNLEIAIATNPIFPEAAITERLKWAGISRSSCSFVTTYENMHFCKPNLDYYREILHNLGRTPSECMMVGNDVDQDMAAGKLGMKTFLADKYIVNRHNRSDIQADYRGSLANLKELLLALGNDR